MHVTYRVSISPILHVDYEDPLSRRSRLVFQGKLRGLGGGGVRPTKRTKGGGAFLRGGQVCHGKQGVSRP